MGFRNLTLFIFVLLLPGVFIYFYYEKTAIHVTNTLRMNRIGRFFELDNNNEPQPALSKGNRVHYLEENIWNPDVLNSKIYYYTGKSEDFYHNLHAPDRFKGSIYHRQEEVVPRKVHFIWFSPPKKKFLFFNMLSVKAAHRFTNSSIYFWFDNLPVGPYWQELESLLKHRLYRIKVKRPKYIWGNKVRNLHHCSDILRLEAILQYGGMYFDFDAFVVNYVDPLLRYDCTLGAEEPYTLANGILFSKPYSDFFKLWYLNYRNFTDKEWATFSTVAAFKIAKENPGLINIQENSLCKPNYYTMRENIFGPEIWDFKRKNYVLHGYWRFSDHKGLHPDDIKDYNTTLGAIFRYIYYDEPSIPNVVIPN